MSQLYAFSVSSAMAESVYRRIIAAQSFLVASTAQHVLKQ